MRMIILLLTLLAALPLGAQTNTNSRLSAWDTLVRGEPALLHQASPIERYVLQSISADQARAYLAGESPARIVTLTGETLEELFVRKGISALQINWYSMDDGGGIELSGAEFELWGTVGQSDAGEMSGGGFDLVGGLIAVPGSAAPTPIFSDGFESGDTSKWSLTIGG